MYVQLCAMAPTRVNLYRTHRQVAGSETFSLVCLACPSRVTDTVHFRRSTAAKSLNTTGEPCPNVLHEAQADAGECLPPSRHDVLYLRHETPHIFPPPQRN
ncbi:hypothetical protein Bbelb_145090 [Branchiostoma belcheri]|nr:hypothetical protein Bbelb_145090 [Branchiostoma belcheri]